MTQYLEVENHKGMVRDAKSRAILVTDRAGVADWKRRKSVQKRQNEEIDILRSQVETLVQSVQDLTMLVKEMMKNNE